MVTEAYLGFFCTKLDKNQKFEAVYVENFTYLSFNDEKMQKK